MMPAHHLYQDTAYDDEAKDVCRDMRQLVVARECQLQRHAKTLQSQLYCLRDPARRNMIQVSSSL